MNQDYIAAIRANAGPAGPMQGRARFVNGRYVLDKPEQRGRGGTATSLISELGGGVGMFKGAAAGAALGSVVPGIGTAIGGVIGGALGGFGGAFAGRLAENRIRDDRWGVGDAAKEGAITGVLGAGPIKLAKAGFAGAKALAGRKAVAPAVTSALEKSLLASMPGTKGLAVASGRLSTRSAGVGVGQKIPGKEALWPDASDSVYKTLKKYGAHKGARDEAARRIQGATGDAQEVLTNAIKGSDKPLTKGGISILITEYKAAIGGKMAHKDVLKSAAEYQRILRNAKNSTDLVSLRTTLYSDAINHGRTVASAVPGRERAAKALTQTINKFLDKASPAVRAADKNVRELKTAGDYVISAAGRLTAASGQAGGGIPGRLIAGDTGQAVKGRLGDFGTKVLVTRGGAPSRVGSLARAITGGQLAGGGRPEQEPQGYPDQPTDYGNQFSSTQQGIQQTQAPQSQFSLQQAIAALQANPSAKRQKQIMDYYNFVSKAEKAQGGGLNVGRVSAQQYQLSQQGTNALNQFAQLIQNDPGVVTRTVVPGRGLPMVGGYVGQASGTTQFDTLGFAAVSSLLRMQSGAAVPDSEVRAYMRAYLPKAGDSPASIQRKLNTLRFAFQTVMEGAGNRDAQDMTFQETPQYQYQGGY